jgi:hypothetical protein
MNSETHDPIDKLLREQDTHVADDGFTSGVIAVLPRRRPLLPRVILLSAVVAGAVASACWLPWQSLPPLDYTKIVTSDPRILSAWLPFLAVAVALVSAALIALRRED